MLNRRELLKYTALASLSSMIPAMTYPNEKKKSTLFSYALNTSTIQGGKLGLAGSLDIASQAGYDGVELWLNDIKDYLGKGNSLSSLAKLLSKKKLAVENGISFTAWMVNDPVKRKAGLGELEEEMKILSAIGCKRIAAPPAGVDKNEPVDFIQAGGYYREILNLGRKYGVIPQLEFWGASETLYSLAQALAIAAAADDPAARILPDVYHLFRGGSGFNGLQLVSGRAIEIIHLNDYPGNRPAGEQTDADRVFPGDGVAPLKEILQTLKNMGGAKVLSLELFNRDYWKQDPLQLAKTGLQKMKTLVNSIA